MLDFVVARALKKDPAVRYQDARELAADLAHLPRRAARAVRRTEPSLGQPDGQASESPTGDKAARGARRARHRRRHARCRFRACSIRRRRLKRIEGSVRTTSAQPRPVGLLRRVVRDAAVRRFFIIALFASAAASTRASAEA